MKNILKFFDQEEKEMLLRTDEFHRVLTHLCFESRIYRSENLKAIRGVMRCFVGVMKKHRSCQEEVVFPFLERHIPRHEAAIHLFEAEHKDIMKKENALRLSLRKLPPVNGDFNDGKIYERGICLISLIRHHVGLEQQHIGKSIRKELHEDEKAAISNRVSKWLRKQAKR